MWLLDTKLYRLHSFLGKKIPQYAILSHRWEEEELTFAMMRECQMVEYGVSNWSEEEEQLFPMLSQLRQYRIKKLKSTKGWAKIEGLCKMARAYNLDWAWIDTICIDKSSSSELQESINSMFIWYELAARCFVYMSDVTADPDRDPDSSRTQFRKSSWFIRGWTLQELLAPYIYSIVFLNCKWVPIESTWNLLQDISLVTNIPYALLNQTGLPSRKKLLLGEYSIAQRMSWAAHRRVTREEDQTYCLLGLFDVNLPLLYGEGEEKAFRRLQLEIIKDSTDESFLTWRPQDMIMSVRLLAPSPRYFAGSSEYRCIHYDLLMSRKVERNRRSALRPRGRSFQVTRLGLLMEAILIDRQSTSYVPRSLKTCEKWTSRFALPLLLANPKQSDYTSTRTVFLQLDHLRDDEFTQGGEFFEAKLNWIELMEHKSCEQFLIRSHYVVPGILRTLNC